MTTFTLQPSPDTPDSTGLITISLTDTPTMLSNGASYITVTGDSAMVNISFTFESNFTSVYPIFAFVSEESSLTLTTITFTSFTQLSSQEKILFISGYTNFVNTVFSSVSLNSSSHRNDDVQDQLCVWDGSLVTFSGKGNSSVIDCSFTNASFGAVELKGGVNLSIRHSLFENNSIFVTNFETARRNVLCTNSFLSLTDPSGGDGILNNSSLWILNNNCTLEGLPIEYTSPLFIPTLTSATYTEDLSKPLVSIEFTGTNILPCDVYLMLTFNTEQNISDVINLTFISSTQALSVLSSILSLYFTNSTYVTASLLYNSNTTTPSIPVKFSTSEHRTRSQSEWNGFALIFLILFLVFFVLFVVAVVLIVILRHYCTHYKSDLDMMKNESRGEFMFDIEGEGRGEGEGDRKEEELRAISQEMNEDLPEIIHLAHDSSESSDGNDEERNMGESEGTESESMLLTLPLPTLRLEEEIQNVRILNVIECIAPFDETSIAEGTTLAEYIHSVDSGGRRAEEGSFLTSIDMLASNDESVEDRLWVLVHVTTCLLELLQRRSARVWSILFSLSPHLILLSHPLPSHTDLKEGRGIYLSLEEQTLEERESAQRYLPPEIEKLDESILGEMNNSEREKAGVFSLGMILYESVTGEAPFAGETSEIAHWNVTRHQKLPLGVEWEGGEDALTSMVESSAEKRADLKAAREILLSLIDRE